MSTTNPDPGRPDPVHPLAPTPPGSPRGDDQAPPGVDPAAVRRGYEADGYDTKSVVGVPILVIVFFVLAFATTTALFGYFAHVTPDPNAHPAAVARNKASVNERLDRIHRGGEVDQPRLEPLKLREGEARGITRPETPTGNSPQLHPEDLRASPEHTPSLYRTGWNDPDKTHARITIDEAMKLAVQNKVFPVAAAASSVDQSSNVPTAANAGRGAAGSTAVPPKIPLKENLKKDNPKEKEKHP